MPGIFVSVPTKDEFKNRQLVEEVCRWIQKYVSLTISYSHDGTMQFGRRRICSGCGMPATYFEYLTMLDGVADSTWIRAYTVVANAYICVGCQQYTGIYIHGAVLSRTKDHTLDGHPILPLTESPART